jgi:hypothetical protein
MLSSIWFWFSDVVGGGAHLVAAGAGFTLTAATVAAAPTPLPNGKQYSGTVFRLADRSADDEG